MQYEASGYLKQGAATVGITKEYFDGVHSAKNTCLLAVDLEEKLSLLLDNFYEFEMDLLRIAEEFRIWGMCDHKGAMQRRLSLDRRVVNLLTACRLYLDQIEHGLSQAYGNPSSQLSSIKVYKNEFYDECFGYRFMEALRNHVQHAGLPVHIITYGSKWIRDENQQDAEFTVLPFSKVSILKENKSFKKAILGELEKADEQVDLRAPIREYVSCLVKLHDRLRETLADKLNEDRNFYESAISDYSTIDGEAVSHPHLIRLNATGEFVEKVGLITNPLEYLDFLLDKNKVNDHLLNSFSSNHQKHEAK